MRTVVEEPVATKSDDIQFVVAECSPVATDEDVGPLGKVQESSVSPISEDESMTIEENLILIPDGVMLPSLTSAEPTKIKFSSIIEIMGVEDGDWYKKNLPSIAPTDKGKKSLEEPDTIQGHPAQNLRKIEGSWVVEEGYDRLVCKCIKCVSSNSSSLPTRVSVTDLSPICLFFKPEQRMDSQPSTVKTWGLYRVCTEVLRYSMFGCLKPVSSFNVCTDIVLVGPVLGVFSIPRRVFDDVSYRIQILDSAPTDFVSSPPHQSSTSTSSMHFSDEIFQGTTTAVGSTPTAVQFSLPRAVSDSFNDLRTSMSRIISLQSKESRRLDDSRSEVLDKIKQLETTILDAFYQQNQAFHHLITGMRQEAHNDTNALSLGLKAVRTQTAILSTDQADARKEAKEQKAIIEDMDERIATLRSEQLDFRAQAQENYYNLSSQLSELVAYITRGNDKNGEGSSSRRPQPPPDDQNRPSGGNANRGGGGGGSGGSGRRDDIKGSSTKMGSGSSGAGGPYKKNAEWWLYGKNRF
ncbi:syntaxin-71-like [Dorcoceras hygrometricum]|uniref:Syntaxin-71-like n=1 Tax=Dorcoceras hygrometricum TaxID=472368 RepID=A0A2Z7BKX2_9LAMI|nr:syntaxin-71-like [Dorcoceras hygrometricum]